MLARCQWADSSLLMQAYHDQEWGVPLHDDRAFFEFLVLEGAQAGLSWNTILNKRDGYRLAFSAFEPNLVAAYTGEDVTRLLANAGIVRNRLKINSAINNARRFLEVQKEFGSFDAYIWQFAGGKPVCNSYDKLSQIPSRTDVSDALSKSLGKRGFTFVGSTICYAFMQATGIVNDHLTSCYRYNQV